MFLQPPANTLHSSQPAWLSITSTLLSNIESNSEDEYQWFLALATPAFKPSYSHISVNVRFSSQKFHQLDLFKIIEWLVLADKSEIEKF